MRTLLLGLACCAITGCGAPSVESLLDNPTRLADLQSSCVKMAASKRKTNKSCINADKAADVVATQQVEAELDAARRTLPPAQ